MFAKKSSKDLKRKRRIKEKNPLPLNKKTKIKPE